MHVLVNTDDLIADGIITRDAAVEMRARGRGIMVALAINAILCFGIFAATGGLIFLLADALSVAVVGLLMLGGGLLALRKAPETYAMFGNAAALIGAGMLIGGAAIELLDAYRAVAGPVMFVGGAFVLVIAGLAELRGGLTARFVRGSILLMGLALHVGGGGLWLEDAQPARTVDIAMLLYAAALIAVTGWLLDIRAITALAIVPFAQVLDTGTGYFGALYAFWSPESTLTILQMTALIAALSWLSRGADDRIVRHAGVLVIMAFIVANLAALVGSLFGDYIGQNVWGPGAWYYRSGLDYGEWQRARDAFQESAVRLSADVYAVLWAIALAALIGWSAHRHRRGLFNAAMTFAAIHAYTQLFESFASEPLAWVLGGLAAIPLAWGMWRLNDRWTDRHRNGEGQE